MRTSVRVWLALGATALAGFVLVIPLSMAMITFLRERMHVYCSFGRMGADDPGSFTCADGIGYILPGLVLWFWVGMLLTATAIATAVLAPRQAARVLAMIGVAGLAFLVTASLVADSGRHAASEIPADTWVSVMAVPSLLLGVASVVLVIAVASRSKALTRVALWTALALLLAATVVEPTLAFGTVPVLLAVGTALVLANRQGSSSGAPAPELSVSER